MFEFSLPALCLFTIGMTYLLIASPLLLPKRKSAKNSLKKQAEKYIAEIELVENNPDIDKKIGNSSLNQDFSAQVLMLKRKHHRVYEINEETILRKDDVLKVMINPQHLAKLKQNATYKLDGDEQLIHDDADKKIYEVMIPYGSSLSGKSLQQLNFRNIYYASVLAIRHRKEMITREVSKIILREGDMLLLYTSDESLKKLVSKKLVVTLSKYKAKKFDLKKAIPTLLILIGVILAAALNITSILISALVGALLIVTTTILKPKEAYEAIEWKVIFMMAGVLSMGAALEKTGGSDLISELIYDSMGSFDPRITLSLIFLVTFLSTNVLSSKAAAALMTPIVISLAAAMQVNSKPFLIAVMFACSLTFMTPVSYPTNTMVYAPGNYKFKDYLKIGTPLNFIIWVAASFIIPLFFPF